VGLGRLESLPHDQAGWKAPHDQAGWKAPHVGQARKPAQPHSTFHPLDIVYGRIQSVPQLFLLLNPGKGNAPHKKALEYEEEQYRQQQPQE
jgi:hypothetical protein